jgi:hypothetical protein
MAADIMISIALVTGIVLLFNQLARMLRNAAMHKTIRDAIGRDSSAVPELIAKMDEDQPAMKGAGDERSGVVLIALAVALAGYALIAAPDAEDLRNIAGLALFPALVGFALIGHAAWARRRGAER